MTTSAGDPAGEGSAHVTPSAPSVGQLRLMVRRFRRDWLAMGALTYLVLLALAGHFAHWVAPFDPKAVAVNAPFTGPSKKNWLGTDDLGRDVLSRLLSGARVSMQFSFGVVLLALLVAIPLGLIAGYFGGVVGGVLMRAMEAIQSLPFLVLAISIVAVLGPSLRNAMLAVSVAIVPGFARLVRGQTLAVREETFIEASRAVGLRSRKILLRHIVPNIISPVIVQGSITLGSALLAEAGLSYLGLGVQPPQATWGGMVQRAFRDVLGHPWAILPAGMAIAFAVLAFNFVGDGLRKSLGAGQVYRRMGRLGLTTFDARAAGLAVPDPPDSSPNQTADGPKPVLDVRALSVEFDTPRGKVRVVDDVSFSIAPGETLGLVGESGSGKTVTAMSIMRLLPSPPARIVGGRVVFDGTDLTASGFDDVRRLRGGALAMVFQDPMASLNPALTIVHQIGQVAQWHDGVSRKDGRRRAVEALDTVGISANRVNSYPHEFSGGMRQRAMIAMALVCRPKLLIADEPTTALDVTIQAQVLELLRDLRDELGMALLFVTHDLGVVADICDRVAVMYAGQIVETASVRDLFYNPRHPYTEGLLRAMPQKGTRKEPLYSIPGQVPQPYEYETGCRLATRCPYVEPRCVEGAVTLVELTPRHLSRCVRATELSLGSGGASVGASSETTGSRAIDGA